jgi:hypothetical protein
VFLRSLICSIAVAVLTVVLPTFAQTPKKLELPALESGRIGDSPAILMWPVADGPGDPAQQLLDPAGCEVHIIPDTDLNKELVYPCGQWFVPPIGKHTSWLESKDFMSATAGTFRFGGGSFQGSGTRLLVPVVPAGVVKVSSPMPADATGATVRLLSLDGEGYAFERPTTPAKATAGVRMPARRAIAGLFGRGGEALTLTHPFMVSQQKAISVIAEAPRNGSGVLAIFGKPADDNGFSQAPATFALEDDRGRHAPDVVLTAPSRIYAVWYGARGASAKLRVDSKELRLDRTDLALLPGRIATLRTQLSFAKKQ